MFPLSNTIVAPSTWNCASGPAYALRGRQSLTRRTWASSPMMPRRNS